MVDPIFPQKRPRARIIILLALACCLLATSGCGSLFGVKRQVSVPPLLGPLTEATTEQLIGEVNRVAVVRSIRGKIDIQFEDTSFAESGIAEKYRTADGTVYLQRPGQIYIKIQAPFVGTNIAEMTSDGERFRVAVLQGDEKYRRFVRGKLPVLPAGCPGSIGRPTLATAETGRLIYDHILDRIRHKIFIAPPPDEG